MRRRNKEKNNKRRKKHPWDGFTTNLAGFTLVLLPGTSGQNFFRRSLEFFRFFPRALLGGSIVVVTPTVGSLVFGPAADRIEGG